MGRALQEATGGDFPDLARMLFGHVRLDFPENHAERRQLRSAVFGDCRVSELCSDRHAVFGDRVVRSSGDPDALKLLIQTQGRSEIRQSGRTVEFGSGVPLLYDPVRPYELINRTDVRLVMLQLPRRSVSARSLAALARPLALADLRRGFPPVLLAMLRTCLAEAEFMEASAAARMGTSLLALIGALVEPLAEEAAAEAGHQTSLAAIVARCRTYIEGELRRPDLCVDDMAARLRCSPRYIFRAFASEGMTPMQHVWESRLRQARIDLADALPQRNITEIAFSLGFSSSAHFSRAFRERFGMTPRDCRRQARPDGAGWPRSGTGSEPRR
jgi:AraC family transcriptional activator of tynA and feaB